LENAHESFVLAGGRWRTAILASSNRTPLTHSPSRNLRVP
jgi:hypothetical protein